MRTTILACALLVAQAIPAHAQPPALFDFHSGFWMNLHHYLHALVRTSETLDEALPDSATAREHEQWARAVEFYRTRFSKRSLVFDGQLVLVKQQLAAAGSAPTLDATKLAPEHRQVLDIAAPIYRRHRWLAHNAANTRFIAVLEALVKEHGRAIATRLARSYDDTWPAAGLRVDVVRDAGPPGNAYTTNVPRPTHITIGAEDLGLASLELLFHESSHHWDQRLMKGVNDAARQLAMPVPPNLWHAMLFFNAGWITTDVLTAAGTRDYRMLMTTGPVFDRPGWHEALARHWPGFLSGQYSRDEAIARILGELR